MTKADRDRGVRTERDLAAFLRAHGFPHAERAVKTGVRTIDRVVADPGDITGTPGLVWQAKALKPLTRAEAMVPRWMVETEGQRADASADLGVLVLRRDQRPVAHWFAFLPVADLYGQLAALTDPERRARLDNPGPWGDERGAIVAWPARLYLGDLVILLRAAGWGEPMPPVPVAPAATPLLSATP